MEAERHVDLAGARLTDGQDPTPRILGVADARGDGDGLVDVDLEAELGERGFEDGLLGAGQRQRDLAAAEGGGVGLDDGAEALRVGPGGERLAVHGR